MNFFAEPFWTLEYFPNDISRNNYGSLEFSEFAKRQFFETQLK